MQPSVQIVVIEYRNVHVERYKQKYEITASRNNILHTVEFFKGHNNPIM